MLVRVERGPSKTACIMSMHFRFRLIFVYGCVFGLCFVHVGDKFDLNGTYGGMHETSHVISGEEGAYGDTCDCIRGGEVHIAEVR